MIVIKISGGEVKEARLRASTEQEQREDLITWPTIRPFVTRIKAALKNESKELQQWKERDTKNG